MPKTIHIALLGDLHFGANRTESLESELDAVFFPWLEENRFDAVVQLGDLYDRRLSLDSSEAKAAMRFVVRLCQLCQQRGVPLRIVKGTLTHDAFQLEMLRPLETEFPTFRLAHTASHEELLPGFDVLWMPEEYPANYGDFYGRFFEDLDGSSLVYDAILGHGEIDVAAGWGAAIEGERRYGGTPTHEAAALLAHSSGPVWFAHIHNRFRYKGRLGYPGSFTRWCQGEEDGKGFDALTLTEKPGGGWMVRARVIPNHMAPVYKTSQAVELLDETDAPDVMVSKILAAAGGDRLRVKFAGFPISVEAFSIVRGALVESEKIEIQASARAVQQGEPAAEEGGLAEAAEADERHERLSYLRDPALTGAERLLRYLHESDPEAARVTLEEVMEMTAP